MAGEKIFENKVKKFLNEQNCWTVKYWGGGGFTRSGVPDLLICCNGRFIAAEIKAENGQPTVLQLITLKRITESGGIAVLLYPKDFEQFRQMIKAIWSSKDSEVIQLKQMFAFRINEELRRQTNEHF